LLHIYLHIIRILRAQSMITKKYKNESKVL
jgi:hypothetical protein